jgi:murein DD-endopeptidase MepM/ murein hydrolase activator NlpD
VAVFFGLMAVGAGGLAAAEPADGPMAANVSPKDQPLMESPPADAEAAVFPVQGDIGFGESAARFGAWRGGRRHEGQDVFAPGGSPLFALRDGKVVEMGDDGGRGNYVAVFNPDLGQTYMYLHMKNPSRASLGEWVRAGERIGAVGCTGSCFGDHLHLELRRGRGAQGKPVDPLPLLQRLQPR